VRDDVYKAHVRESLVQSHTLPAVPHAGAALPPHHSWWSRDLLSAGHVTSVPLSERLAGPLCPRYLTFNLDVAEGLGLLNNVTPLPLV